MTPTTKGLGGNAGSVTPADGNTSPAPDYHIRAVLDKLREVKPGGQANTWTSLCPAHKDKRQSLSITLGDDGRILMRCFSGCLFEKIVAALGMDAADFGPTSQPKASLTLLEYSTSKRLPLSFLATLGLRETSLGRGKGERAVAIPYYSIKGEQIGLRYRLSMTGDMRFRWRDGSRTSLYGLQRLAKARETGYVLLLEGESDCQTGWLHDLPAIGLPGAGVWREDWAAFFDGFERIYIADERDGGTAAIRTWIAKSAIRDRVWFFSLLDGVKDLSELHCTDLEGFDTKLQAAREAAVAWTEADHQERAAASSEAWEKCKHLAELDNILEAFGDAVARTGLAGEQRTAQILYLAMTSRLSRTPVNVVVRGPSGGGKNYVMKQVASFFGREAYVEMSGMSPHYLAYCDEPLAHRHLLLYELEGLDADFGAYILRSLLSEGHIIYRTLVKGEGGLVAVELDKPGPTGLLVSTTRAAIHPENETRLMSLTITDTNTQTAAVFSELARSENGPGVGGEDWRALQTWLAGQPCEVHIGFAGALALLVPAVSVRLRRDFGQLLTLIRAHAILHQATRRRGPDGRIEADLTDYEAVADLVGPVIAETVGTTIPATVRETVLALGDLSRSHATVSTRMVAEALGICRRAAASRLSTALVRGLASNLESTRGKAARWATADPLPEDVALLPTVEALYQKWAQMSGAPGGVETVAAGVRDTQTHTPETVPDELPVCVSLTLTPSANLSTPPPPSTGGDTAMT